MNDLYRVSPLSIGVIVIGSFIFFHSLRHKVEGEKRNFLQRFLYALGITALYLVGMLFFLALFFQVKAVAKIYWHKFI